MGEYNWISPGAAAGSEIEKVLTRRRDEERQRLLDEVSSRNSEVQRRATEANIKAQNERQERERLGIATEGWGPDEDLSNTPKDILDLARRYGLTKGRPEDGGIGLPGGIAPSAGGIMGPDPADHGNYYVGSPQDRERKRRTGVIDRVERELQDPNLNETQRLFKVAKAETETNANLGSGIYAAMADPKPNPQDEWFPVLNPDGSETGNWAPKGAHFTPREPREPRDRPQFLDRPVIGPDGKPDPTKAFVMTDGGIKVVPLPATMGAKPPSGGAGKLSTLPAGLRTDLSNKRREAVAGKPGGQAGFNQAVESIISAALQQRIISPDVALTVRDVISNQLSPTSKSFMDWITMKPSKTVPSLQEILGNYSEADFDTPEEYSQFADLLSTIY